MKAIMKKGGKFGCLFVVNLSLTHEGIMLGWKWVCAFSSLFYYISLQEVGQTHKILHRFCLLKMKPLNYQNNQKSTKLLH